MTEEKKQATQDFQQLGLDFQNSLRDFISRTDRLSKKSLARVNKALAAHPLEEVVKLAHQDEIEVFNIGAEIQAQKISMMIESLKQDNEEARVKAAREARVPDNIDKPDYAEEKDEA